MKKKDIINLIKYHTENNESGFRDVSFRIAKEFSNHGDSQLSEYVIALLTNSNTFSPQFDESEMPFFNKVEYGNEPLPLPKKINESMKGIINAITRNMGVNKFLFQGPPGTGKTESVKQIARITERQLFSLDFASVVDSKLGQTSKNIVRVFNEINNLKNPSHTIILFDEIDAIAMDRINSNDLREMGRVTSTLLKELDKMKEEIILVATTNLYSSFDKALTRRFDLVLDFDKYSREDLIDISEVILDHLLKRFNHKGRNMKLLRKIVNLYENIPLPGDLKNIFRTSLAFSNPSSELDYLKRIYYEISGETEDFDLKTLSNKGFTVREIEILTGISKSQVSRKT